MNLLRRLGLVRSLDSLTLFGRPPSNGLLRPVDLPSSPAAATSKDWVMLNSLVRPMDDTVAADARTVAETRTTKGCHLRVAMGIATPPASSFLYYDLVDCGPRYNACTPDPTVIATQGDSVLFEMNHIVAGSNYLVYTAGAATTAPSPSLSLVPARIARSGWELRKVSLLPENTGILRRGGEEELLVAQLEESTEVPPRDTANIWVLPVGEREWKLKDTVPVVADTGSTCDKRAPWRGSESDKVVGVGVRFLCWVHYRNGILVYDMLEERLPKLRYVPVPVVPPPWKDYYEDDNRPPIEVSRNVFGTGDGALRFVSIDLRCCCGGFGMSTCEHSRSAFMVTTWSLVLSTKEPMVWMKNTVLHCEELWALPGYEGLPRVHPECPILSLHNPDVVCFRVSEDDVTWMIEFDTRSKTLLSALRCTTDAQERNSHFPVKVDYSY